VIEVNESNPLLVEKIIAVGENINTTNKDVQTPKRDNKDAV